MIELGREEMMEWSSGIKEELGLGIYRDNKEILKALTATAFICGLLKGKGIWENGIVYRIRMALPANPSLLSFPKQEKPGTRILTRGSTILRDGNNDRIMLVYISRQDFLFSMKNLKEFLRNLVGAIFNGL